MIYILVYNEWDGGGGSFSENVIASSDKSKLEEYQKELEDKSAVLRGKLERIDDEFTAKLQPLWDEFNPIIMKLAPTKATKLDTKEREKLVAQRKEIHEKISAIQKEAYKRKDGVKNEINIEYWVDDPELANFTIDELEEM